MSHESKAIRPVKLFAAKTVGAIALIGLALSVVSPFEPVQPASASSSPWNQDSLYGCVGQPIDPFVSMPDDGTDDGQFSVLAGQLPAGLSLNSQTGIISGTPTAVFNDRFIIASPIDPDHDSQTVVGLIDSLCRPTLDTIDPPTGSTLGGQVVTIVGTGFDSQVTVAVDDAGTPDYLTVLSATSTRISAIMPAYSTPGQVTLIIRNPDGSRLRSAGAFSYSEPVVTPSVAMFDATASNQINTVTATHFTHTSPDGFGVNTLIALTGFGDNPPQTGYAIVANFPFYSDGSFNSINNDLNTSCQNGPAVTISSSAPSWAPTPPAGVIYRALEVQTGTYQNDAAWNCIAPGTYQMRLHVYDSQRRSAYFDFSISEAPGTPTRFLQPLVSGIATFGDLTVGSPIADDPYSDTLGVGIRTDGDRGTFSISSSALIPDLAVNLTSGGKGGGGDPYVSGTPTSSGPYSFTITSTVAQASPSTYSQTFSGFVRYASAHRVTFNGNQATGGNMDVQTADLKTPLNVNAFSKTGYTFQGWSTSATTGGTFYADDSIYEFDADVTLYAQWVALPPVAHTVTFNGNGATSGTMSSQIHAGSATLQANSFSKTGYVFDEWNTAIDGSGSSYDDATTYSFDSDTTLYAMWEYPAPIGGGNSGSHTITFLGNGAASGSTETQTSNGPAAVRQNGFVRPGYVFHDWNSTSNHTGFELDAGEIYQFGADITLYAEWTKIPLAAVTLTIGQKLTMNLALDESKDLLVNVVGATGVLVPVEVAIPSGVSGAAAQVRITPRSNDTALSLGAVSVQVEILDKNGAPVESLASPMSLHILSQKGALVVAKSEDGLIWLPIPMISSSVLPSGMTDGYYLDQDGTVIILSNHLTVYGLKKAQPVQQTVSAKAVTLYVNATSALVSKGGSGVGVVLYQSNTPATCSVSSTGVVKGIKPGACAVVAIKAGDEIYLHSSSKPVKLNVLAVPIVVGVRSVLISLGAAYANKRVGIESSVKNNGLYRVLGSIKLNQSGVGTFNRMIAPATTLRVRYATKTLATLRFQPAN